MEICWQLNFTLCFSACAKRCCVDCRRTRFAGRLSLKVGGQLTLPAPSVPPQQTPLIAYHACRQRTFVNEAANIGWRHVQEVGCLRCRDLGFHSDKCHSFVAPITLRKSISRRVVAGGRSSVVTSRSVSAIWTQ